jgi:hypothetical protein
LRPVGESLAGGDASAADPDDEFAEDTNAGTPPFGRPVLPHESRAGYDDASGSTDAARTQ